MTYECATYSFVQDLKYMYFALTQYTSFEYLDSGSLVVFFITNMIRSCKTNLSTSHKMLLLILVFLTFHNGLTKW